LVRVRVWFRVGGPLDASPSFLSRWVDAIPVMQHFDMLDQRGTGKLYAEDLELIAAREAQSKELQQQRKLLAGLASRAGVEGKRTKQSQHIVAAQKYESEGDYAAAARALEEAVTWQRDARRGSCAKAESMEDAQSHDKVRERVHSLLRLAEMKWRYRVVEKGQSPRDEGLKLLYMAKQVRRSATRRYYLATIR